MNTIQLNNRINYAVTSIPNAFLDRFMPSANGEFVKVYLYLLRKLNEGGDVSVCGIADILNNTEKDVLRALKYWEQQGLVSLRKSDSRELTEITLLSVPGSEPESTPDTQETVSPEVCDTSHATEFIKNSDTLKINDKPENTVSETKRRFPPAKRVYSASELELFKKQDDISMLLYAAERYMGKTLGSTDINTILYIYDELKFSPELIEYLIEYCVGNSHRSMRYIEKVALSWVEEGIKDVKHAKMSADSFNTCYPVLKAFGLNGRNPGKSERDFIVKWTNSYGFTMDIILDACNRTIQTIHQPSFDYADSILKRWNQNGVQRLDDIKKLDAEHARQKEARESDKIRKGQNQNSGNTFNDFSQRTYDYNALEKKILANR